MRDRAGNFGDRVVSLMRGGDYEEVARLYIESERAQSGSGELNELVECFQETCIQHCRSEERERAMKAFKAGEMVCREFADREKLKMYFSHIASYLDIYGFWKDALKVMAAEFKLINSKGLKFDEWWVRGRQAGILREHGQIDAAVGVLKKMEKQCAPIDDFEFAEIVIMQAEFLADAGRNEEALPIAERATKLAYEVGMYDLIDWVEPILEKIRAELRG